MKKSIYIIVGICTLLLVTILGLHAWLPGFLSEKIAFAISTEMNEETNELYVVEAGTTSFSPFFGTTRIAKIRITPNDSILDEGNVDLLPRQVFEAAVYDLKISTRTLIDLALQRKEVKVNKLNADSIFLSVYTNYSGKVNERNRQAMNMEQIFLDNISTHKLSIVQRSLTDTSKQQVFQTGKLDVSGSIRFSGEESDPSGNPGFHVRSLSVLGINIHSNHGLHTFHVDKVLFDDKKQTADLNGIRMTPKYSKLEFRRHIPFEQERFDLSLDHIKLSGLQQDRIMQDSVIIILQIEVNEGRLEVFRDKNPPFNESLRPPPPARHILDAPYGLFISEILLNNVDIIYEQLAEGADTIGQVPFKNLNASIYNLSNLKDSLALDSVMNIRAEALTFNEALLQTEFNYTITDPNGAFTARGELAPLHFTSINMILFPLTGIKVISGMHHKTYFNIYGDNTQSAGEIMMRYSDLEVDLAPDRGRVIQGIAGFVGPNFLYHQDNPENDGELRVGQVSYERDVTRFVFHYWWHSFFSGAKDTYMQKHFN